MKSHELRELSIVELESRLSDARGSLSKLRFTRATTGQVENPSRFNQTKREVARLLTIITEKNSANG